MDKALIAVKLVIHFIDKAKAKMIQLANRETCSMTRDTMEALSLNLINQISKVLIKVRTKVLCTINHFKR